MDNGYISFQNFHLEFSQASFTNLFALHWLMIYLYCVLPQKFYTRYAA